MSGLCLAAGLIIASLPLHAFTLAWTHSIEKIRWEEDYRIVDHRLVLVEARIKGSGAGMEPPDGAVLEHGIWHYRPPLAPLERLHLSHSPYIADYELCDNAYCRPLKFYLPKLPATSVVTLTACR